MGDLESIEASSEASNEVEVGNYDQLIGNETDSVESSGDGQPANVDPSQSTPEELSLEEMLGKVAGPEKDAQKNHEELLKQLNGIGAVHKGLPVEVKSIEEVKEALQMRHDYTQKTMALAEEARVKQEEFAKREGDFKQQQEAFAQERTSHQEQITQFQIFGNILDQIKSDDPELYAHLESLASKEVQSFQRQQAYSAKESQKFNELHQKLDSVLTEKNQQRVQEIRQGWEKELSEVQAKHAPALTKMGIVPDWKKVQEAWAADSTGKMTVAQALDATHGEAIRKSYQSQLQLQQAKNKSAQALLSRNSAGSSVRKSANPQPRVEIGNYDSLLREDAS